MLRKGFPKVYCQPWIQICLLIGVCFLLYFSNLGRWDLWNPDEPRYAQVAKEMVEGGDWVLMHYNGRVYPDKPPLFFWMIAFSSYLWGGFSSFSVRFPSALFGTLTVLLTFILGRVLYSWRVGFLSGLVLATSLEFAYLSTRANIDATLTFFTTASLLSFFLWYRDIREEASLKDKVEVEEKAKGRSLWIYGFYVGMALATLAKGPVGFLLPLLVGLIYLGVQRDWGGIRRMRLLSGMGLFLVIVLSWYLAAIAKGGEDYLHATLFRHSIDRYAQGWSKGRAVYYYLYHFPMEFLPWTLFLPGALVYGFSKASGGKRTQFLFLFVWFVSIFVFFSISKGKRGLYLLPLYPAASLMVGKLWGDFIAAPMEHFRNAWISIPLLALMAMALLAGAAIPWVLSMKFPSYLRYGLPITFVFVGSSLVMFVLYRFKNYGAVLLVLIAMVAASYFYTSRVVFPLVNPYKSARYLAEEIKARVRPGDRVAVYGRISSGPFNYYTGIVPILDLSNPDDLLHALESSERVFCLLDYKEFSRLQKMEGRPKFQLLSRRVVGDDDIVLISNR